MSCALLAPPAGAPPVEYVNENLGLLAAVACSQVKYVAIFSEEDAPLNNKPFSSMVVSYQPCATAAEIDHA